MIDVLIAWRNDIKILKFKIVLKKINLYYLIKLLENKFISYVMAYFIDGRINIIKNTISKLNDLKTTKTNEFDNIAKGKKNCLIATGVGAGVGLLSTGAAVAVTI